MGIIGQYDLVGLMAFLAELFQKLSTFTNSELVVLFVGFGSVLKICETSTWFQRMKERYLRWLEGRVSE